MLCTYIKNKLNGKYFIILKKKKKEFHTDHTSSHTLGLGIWIRWYFLKKVSSDAAFISHLIHVIAAYITDNITYQSGCLELRKKWKKIAPCMTNVELMSILILPYDKLSSNMSVGNQPSSTKSFNCRWF